MFLFISCLCGEGARQWAEENGVPVCNPEDLITGNYIIIAILSYCVVMIIDGAKEIYLDHMERLTKFQSNEEEEEPRSKRQKCEDKFNQVSGTSSNDTLR